MQKKEASLYFNLGHPHANTGYITDTGSGKVVMGGVKNSASVAGSGIKFL